MNVASRKISDDVLKVLDAAIIDGPNLVLTGQLDRKMYTRTNEIIEAAGGKWNRKAKAHVFDGSAADAMEPIILTGEIIKPQDFGFFPTPLDIVSLLLDRVGPAEHHRALEPSAGTGNIVRMLKGLVASIDCYELQSKNVDALLSIPEITVTHADFLTVEPTPIYDIVVMNPPFARQDDIRHVMHAAKFLNASGRLASVMSAGVLFRDNKLTTDFRQFVADRGGEFERLDDGAFKESGTTVNTCIVSFAA